MAVLNLFYYHFVNKIDEIFEEIDDQIAEEKNLAAVAKNKLAKWQIVNLKYKVNYPLLN